MIEDASPYVQTLLGTLFTWGVTALGAGLVYCLPSGRNTTKLLDCSLGFAAGVMLAASYWSLLAPALEHAEGNFEAGSKLVWTPVAFGFALGAAFVAYAGKYTEHLDLQQVMLQASHQKSSKNKTKTDNSSISGRLPVENQLRRRKPQNPESEESTELKESEKSDENSPNNGMSAESWKRMMALIIAITVHNIPEGLAVGVGFASAQANPDNFGTARNLALGIGLQNFPEGLAVSVPLAAAGMSKHRAFFWGQLSGFVEPIAGMFGALFVGLGTFLLPYALGFAAGAMIYVVMDDIIPDACSRENASLAAKFSIVGFIVMMAMDVALG